MQFCFIRFWINVQFPGLLWLISLKVGLLTEYRELAKFPVVLVTASAMLLLEI